MPTVVVAPDLAGIWRYPATTSSGGFRALCEHADDGRPLGFALLGGEAQGKALLIKAMSEGRF